MKKQILLAFMCMVALLGAAKDLKTLHVTTQPPMSCNNCENKIKKNIRFEKGVHQISTDLKGQVVTIVYDAEKTDENKIVEAFEKIKYKAIILEDEVPTEPIDKCAKEEEDCCKKK